MPCSDILAGLNAIAAAMAGLKPGTTNVSCGDGACGAVGGAISGMTNDQIIPQESVTEPGQGGSAPEGFDTWEEYFAHKCKAAWFMWYGMRNLFNTLAGLSGIAAIAAGVSPAIIGWTIGLGVVFPPGGLALLITYCLAFLVATLGAFFSFEGAIGYWDANKMSIICAMYESGSADDAINILADWYENAIEAIEWEGVLAPLGPALAGILAQVGAVAINTNVANVLFTLAEDVLLPDVTCECAGASEWHFDSGVEGWVFVGTPPEPVTEEHGWTDAESGKDNSDGSAGRLYVNVDMVAFNPPSYYPTWERALPPGYIVHTGDTFVVDLYAAGGNHWVQAGIQYTDDSGDSSGWVGNWVSWGPQLVTVTAPNTGKSIKLVYACFEKRATGTAQFAVDKAILTIA